MADVIEITAEVRERELRLTSIPMMPSGSRNHLQIRVTFDAEWVGTTKTLVAYRDLAHPYHVPLGLDGTALIPHEVLAEQGVVYLGVFGVAGDQRITSTIVRYGVNEGALAEGLQPSDPTPEMWEQLITAVNEVRQAAESAMRDAQTAAQGAQRSEQAAAGSATQADDAATRAETAADTATTAAGNAVTAKTDAQTAQRAAAQSATDAQQAANRAEQAAGNMSTAVTQAQDAAQAAQQSATQAQDHAKSAGDSAASAAQAQQGAADAETAARQSAAQAQSAQETATQAATEAGESARQAAGAQTAAQNSAQSAGQQATAAATSAQQAKQSQTAAAGSATGAQASAAEATKQAAASEASAVRAEKAATEVEQSAQQIAGAIDRLVIHETAAGNPVVIRDGADWQMEGLRVYGKSEQAGVPSPESPQEIVSKTVTEISVTGDGNAQTVTLSAPVTLRGVPVTSGGNVTISGQRYMADLITEREGVVGVERWVKWLELPVAEMNNSEDYPGWVDGELTENLINTPYMSSLSSHLAPNSVGSNIGAESGVIYIRPRLTMTQSEWKAKYPEVVINLAIQMKTAVFNPLPEPDQRAIRALRTYHGNTVVTAGAHTEVDYIADPKLYIDGKVTSLVTAYMQSIPVTIPLLDEEVVDNEG